MPQETPQILAQFSGSQIASERLLLEAFETDGFKVSRCGGIERARGNRFALFDLSDDRRWCFASERSAACQKVIEKSPKRINIYGRAEGTISRGLFRRHVAGRTEHLAGLGH